MRNRWLFLSVLILTSTAVLANGIPALGRQLFFDPNLSQSRTQSCATCHDPNHAFSDQRPNRAERSASTGHSDELLGDRNTPSTSYAAMIPQFHIDADGLPRGGLFLDGRANTLTDQAREPFLNPIEMGLTDLHQFATRIRANTSYAKLFKSAFDGATYDDDTRLYTAATQALASFQRGADFSTFDSRYDRFLAGEIELTIEEELGRRLFFSDLVNCMNCHLQERNRVQAREMFSDFRYHNIGLPRHRGLRRANGLGEAHTDIGLAVREDVDAVLSRGQYRTPSLRNVAVTPPYMHHGLFQRLETALHFYNRYLVDNHEAGINPESEQPWGPAEVGDTIAHELLSEGQPLGADRIATLIVFLRALTDRRYEHLLPSLKPAGEEHP